MPSWMFFDGNETSFREAGERVGAKNGCRLKPQRPEMPAAQGVFGFERSTKIRCRVWGLDAKYRAVNPQMLTDTTKNTAPTQVPKNKPDFCWI